MNDVELKDILAVLRSGCSCETNHSSNDDLVDDVIKNLKVGGLFVSMCNCKGLCMEVNIIKLGHNLFEVIYGLRNHKTN